MSYGKVKPADKSREKPLSGTARRSRLSPSNVSSCAVSTVEGVPTSGREGRVLEHVIMVHGNMGVGEALGTMREGVPCFSRAKQNSEARHRKELGTKNPTMPSCPEETESMNGTRP